MLDITNNPVGFEPPKPNIKPATPQQAPGSMVGKPTPPAVNQNIPSSSTEKAPEKVLHPTPQPKYEDSKIELISTNSSGMNIFTKLFLVATIIFVVGHIAFFLYYLANKNQIISLDKTLAAKTADLNTLKPIEEKAEMLNTANSELNKYYRERIDWKALWNEIDGRLLKKSQITNFSLDEKGAFNFSGQTGSLTDLAKTIVSFKSSKILKDIKMSGTSFSIDENDQVKVIFSFSGTVDLTSVRIK